MHLVHRLDVQMPLDRVSWVFYAEVSFFKRTWECVVMIFIMKTEPILGMVTCFAVAPCWLNPLAHLQSRSMRALRLPENVCALS
jgi:hypothetical protein